MADTTADGELYGVDLRTINYHIKKILEDHELDESSVIRKYWITASDGKKNNAMTDTMTHE